jgi:hypothetical protein
MLEPIGGHPPSWTVQISEKGRRYGYAGFDWGFCDELTQSEGASRLFESVSAWALHLWMMLLIFTAGPMRRFRFGLNRHKYATYFAFRPRSRTAS